MVITLLLRDQVFMAERPARLRLDAQYAVLDAMLGDIMILITQLGPRIDDGLLARINDLLERISDLMDELLANEPRR